MEEVTGLVIKIMSTLEVQPSYSFLYGSRSTGCANFG